MSGLLLCILERGSRQYNVMSAGHWKYTRNRYNPTVACPKMLSVGKNDFDQTIGSVFVKAFQLVSESSTSQQNFILSQPSSA